MEVSRPQLSLVPATQTEKSSPQTLNPSVQDRIDNTALAKTEVIENSPQPLEADQLRNVVSEISSFVQNQQREINFRISDSSGRTVIEVYDKDSEQLIREIPSEEIQRIAEAIRDQLDEGILLKLEV